MSFALEVVVSCNKSQLYQNNRAQTSNDHIDFCSNLLVTINVFTSVPDNTLTLPAIHQLFRKIFGF